MTRCTCPLCRGFRSNGGGHFYNMTERMLYARVVEDDNDPDKSLPSVLRNWIRLEGEYGGPESLGQEYALITHKGTACIVDGEDIHPTHNLLPNAQNTSPILSMSRKRRRRRAISDSGASKHMFSNKSKFRNYKACENVSIRVAESSSARVFGTGDVGPLTNVLHVEGLLFNLVTDVH